MLFDNLSTCPKVTKWAVLESEKGEEIPLKRGVILQNYNLVSERLNRFNGSIVGEKSMDQSLIQKLGMSLSSLIQNGTFPYQKI